MMKTSVPISGAFLLVLAAASHHHNTGRSGGGTTKLRLRAKLAAVVRDDFLSVGIDTGLAARHWAGLNFSSPRLMTLASALQPAVLRFGGTEADCLVFGDDVSPYSSLDKCQPLKKNTRPFAFNTSMWLELSQFVERLGRTRLLFDLNSLLRDANGSWSSDNAQELISTVRQARIPLIWQLGNEPTIYQHTFGYTVAPETLGDDFVRLRRLLGADAQIVGPDVNRPAVDETLQERPVDMPAQKYLERFLSTGSAAQLTAATFHQYYFNGRTARLADFLDVRYFALLSRQIAAVRAAAGGAAVWLTETSTAWGGGAAGLSDSFVAGFLWLDKLGVSARNGVSLVVRQSLYGGHYALLDPQLQPNPDFWLSYLYKQLVGPRVLQLDVIGPPGVRVYCHCGLWRLPPRAVTCYTLNLSPQPAKLRLEPRLRRGGLQYTLTPPGGNLTARETMCNGQRLAMDGDALPTITPHRLPPASTLTVPGYSMAFHVFRRAAPRACLAG